MSGILPRKVEPVVSLDAATLLGFARQARQLRATMSNFLPRDLLVDPAWDMMLDLFIASGTGEVLYVKDLMLLSDGTTGSVMRRIDRLQEAGLLTRQLSHNDHRRVRVALTNAGHTAMAMMLEHLFDHRETNRSNGPRSFTPVAKASSSSHDR